MNNYKLEYNSRIFKSLQQKFNYKNNHQVPKLIKIVVSMGLGLKAQNKAYLENAVEEIRQITGQHPVITHAKKSISTFKVREGMPLGIFVTLRGEKMYAFLERLIKLVLPRLRDFNGISPKNFDAKGNFNFGIFEQLVFPEINFDSVDERRGLNISIVTSASNDLEAEFLLSEFGFPFSKS